MYIVLGVDVPSFSRMYDKHNPFSILQLAKSTQDAASLFSHWFVRRI
jgi:hypothetical protein